ncbi:hypothetical protein [Brevibacillus dissolubilis]|uniref:hypothetical protein n=1 Tax=Brevibacillus dissolubilis TaxID=1844116 RepID=UPI0011168579|nr:hypothetical protein [Brevibacillus dissolubilis]
MDVIADILEILFNLIGGQGSREKKRTTVYPASTDRHPTHHGSGEAWEQDDDDDLADQEGWDDEWEDKWDEGIPTNTAPSEYDLPPVSEGRDAPHQHEGGAGFKRPMLQPSVQQPAQSVASVKRPNAREGMKWALIFSPPRSKQPYGSPPLTRKR